MPGLDLPRRLPLAKIQVGSQWLRVHTSSSNALWFGPSHASPPIHRFDDPAGQFGVCYLATTVEVSFAETFLRNPPVRILGLEDLAARSFATVEVQRELRLVALYGSGLARLGTTTEPASSLNYALSQAWSRAFWEHPDKPDGLAYRSRHDDSAFCVAAYDRAKTALAIINEQTLTEDPRLLTRLLKRYGLGLTR